MLHLPGFPWGSSCCWRCPQNTLQLYHLPLWLVHVLSTCCHARMDALQLKWKVCLLPIPEKSNQQDKHLERTTNYPQMWSIVEYHVSLVSRGRSVGYKVFNLLILCLIGANQFFLHCRVSVCYFWKNAVISCKENSLHVCKTTIEMIHYNDYQS